MRIKVQASMAPTKKTSYPAPREFDDRVQAIWLLIGNPEERGVYARKRIFAFV